MTQRREEIRQTMLLVVERLPGSKYRCLCDCGKERVVNVGHFNTGMIKSCGCHKPNHGHAGGGKHTREYVAWSNMLARCGNPKNKRFKDYGEKGIVVCDRWQKFGAFLADMGHCPDGYTIEREDNQKGYSPNNCHWASRSENQRNRSISRRYIVVGIEYPTLQEAADAHGVSAATISAWCLGRVAEGRYYPPRRGCEARQVYPGLSGVAAA